MAKIKETLIVLTPGFPKNEEDTTCLPFLQTHIRAVNQSFPELEIIILAFQYPFFGSVYNWHGNEVISFGGRERSKMSRFYIWLRVWRKLKKISRKKNIIGLFSLWCTECALIGSRFGKLNGLKHFVWICGQDAKRGNKYVRLMRPKAIELIAMSDFLKREFNKNYGVSPAHVIPLGVDGGEFSDTLFNRDIDVLGIGSLIPLKQYDVFVKIIYRLVNFLPEINCVICGNGPERSKLDTLISELQLKESITFMGEIPHRQALQSMQRAKIFLHTSNYEGFGTVCLEALYAGAHVVTFTKPMDIEIPNWHHVNSEEEMIIKVLELLQDDATIYESLCVYSSRDIAIAMIKLLYN